MKATDKIFEEKESTELAIGTFAVGSSLFALYIITDANPNVLVIAFPFVVSALVLNTIMFIHLLDKFIQLWEYRKDIAVKILILLSNIPITFLYYSIVMKI